MKFNQTGTLLVVFGFYLQATGWTQAEPKRLGGPVTTQLGGARPVGSSAGAKAVGAAGGASAACTPGTQTGVITSKVTLMRVVDCEGKIDYVISKDATTLEKKRTDLTAQYERAVAWRKQTDSTFEKQGLKNERVAPVQPVMDVVKTDVAKTDVSAALRDAKDWAVYEITTASSVKRVLAYAGSDGFANALADAEFARVYNQWVKSGKKDGAEPKPPTVSMVGEACNKMQAQKILSSKPLVSSTPPAK
jgi:hypothetical protein